MRKIMITAAAISIAALSCGAPTEKQPAPRTLSGEEFARPSGDIEIQRYICRKLPGRPIIDGRVNEEEWKGTSWTGDFVDITGAGEYPSMRTQARMAWDDDFLYIAARLEEQQVQASFTNHDDIIWHENDFEVFIDPDGDTHEYFEVEINALATVFDLFLVKPYRDGGPALHHWDIAGLEKAVHIDGTLNDPSDTDTGWEVELAIPWKVLSECANTATPPSEGDIWRINFSRVEWKTVVEEGRYVKATDPETGKPYAESNWTWSPQGIVNMHYPEMWGYVLFTAADRRTGGNSFMPSPNEKAWDVLRELYYAEKTWYLRYGEYTDDLGALGLHSREIYDHVWPPILEATRNGFEARFETMDDSGTKQITEEGRTRILE